MTAPAAATAKTAPAGLLAAAEVLSQGRLRLVTATGTYAEAVVLPSKPGGASYLVRVAPDGSSAACSCPAAQWRARERCKHAIALLLVIKALTPPGGTP